MEFKVGVGKPPYPNVHLDGQNISEICYAANSDDQWADCWLALPRPGHIPADNDVRIAKGYTEGVEIAPGKICGRVFGEVKLTGAQYPNSNRAGRRSKGRTR